MWGLAGGVLRILKERMFGFGRLSYDASTMSDKSLSVTRGTIQLLTLYFLGFYKATIRHLFRPTSLKSSSCWAIRNSTPKQDEVQQICISWLENIYDFAIEIYPNIEMF